MSLYDERIERLINAAIADGELTEKEKQILFRNAQAEGIDLDEFEMILESRLYEKQQENIANANAQAVAMSQAQAQVAQAQAAAQPAAPKSTKFGDVRKCPACGAIVAAGSASCVECGYAFTEDSGASAMDKLYERLAQIDDKYLNRPKTTSDSLLGELNQLSQYDVLNKVKEKMNAITMFNVPNTRTELLSLLTSLQPLADPKGPKTGWGFGGEKLGYGYWVLFTNCINKAKISFASDKIFAPYFEFYEQKTAKQKSGGFFSLFKK